jgi:hypothetical protein
VTGILVSGSGAAVTRLLIIKGTRCSLAKVAARQATVRVPVLQTDPALAVASNAAFWHKDALSVELVPQIVGPVAARSPKTSSVSLLSILPRL